MKEEILNCKAIRCPFEQVCRHNDITTDRSHGCHTLDFIIMEAQRIKLNKHTPVVGAVISEEGLSKIEKVKRLRDETGLGLRACVDALNFTCGNLSRARDYIKHGW